jgi:hypothetical protein
LISWKTLYNIFSNSNADAVGFGTGSPVTGSIARITVAGGISASGDLMVNGNITALIPPATVILAILPVTGEPVPNPTASAFEFENILYNVFHEIKIPVEY